MAFEKPNRAVDRVFVHCSASDRPEHDDVEVMRGWHVNDRGWSDVGYHFFIKKDGTVQPGRDLETTPAAQKGHNTGTIAICLHGLTAENFTKEQYKSVIELCQAINSAYRGMVTFHGHREVSSKSCPVFPYKEVLGLDDHGSMDFAPTVSPGVVAAPKPARPTVRLTDSGPAVVELQKILSARDFDVDMGGVFGQLTLRAVEQFQGKEGLEVDGIVGPNTWKALLS